MINSLRQQFPILNQTVNDEPLIYFDNAATTQKPQVVLEAMMRYYQEDNANIHRGVHSLAERATTQYEAVRSKVAQFIGAKATNEIIYTSGTTASLNFLARGLIEPIMKKGDIILTTTLEHHSNYVPWQAVCQRTGAKLKMLPLTEDFTVDLAQLPQAEALKSVKALVIQHVSNVLGVEQPLRQLTEWAHQHNIVVIVDGAQAVAHQSLDIEALGVDAYCFSGHKLYGPTGIGICYLNRRHHATCQPFFYGGEMIHYVGDETSNYKEAPWKFEGGTPPIAEVIGLGAAIDWLNDIGMKPLQTHVQQLTQRLTQGMSEIDGVTVYHQGQNGILSFNIEGVHPHDAATGYDMEGIAVRAGHHCAQPLMRYLDVHATLRASLAVYNTEAEVNHFIEVTKNVKEFFNGPI
ncbi:aminotransferase class V-fold PLP-dependent enzyme [Globicatella sulfidifaciens]|uniref:Cysteine desulfurase n=1 Tax=Globicatella sulfidifaciens DSM 15739 TaxID=1121925 RepID=A0A1T4KSI3_9LACT|nr:SufS family cysteine desulfurase [Globicatella sulfidifaciens]SJZ45361.1 cysteine desulfurase / selenocysteine lyase [Globicatella sulfidifaciens DSM 15739]